MAEVVLAEVKQVNVVRSLGEVFRAVGFQAVDRAGRVEARAVEDVLVLTGEVRAVNSLKLDTPRSESWQEQIKWLAEDGAEV